MWAASVVEGTELESYSTLEDMTRDADAVIRLVILAGFIVNDGGRAVIVQGAELLEAVENVPFREAVTVVRSSGSQECCESSPRGGDRSVGRLAHSQYWPS